MNTFNNKYQVENDISIRAWFKEKGYRITGVEKRRDMEDGIDYIGYIPLGNNKTHKIYIDMKNTDDLYFLNMFNGAMIPRHPFRPNSKATHYFFIRTMELVPIQEHLDKSIKDKDSFFEFLKSINMKSIDGVKQVLECVSDDLLCLKIKKILQPYLQGNYDIKYLYDRYDTRWHKTSFKIYERKN